MIAKLPAFSNPSASRAESSNSISALPTQTNQAASFERTLQQSQRASRLRDQSRGAEIAEKAVEQRKENGTVSKQKTSDAKPVESHDTNVQEAEQAPAETASPVTEETTAVGEAAKESETEVIATEEEAITFDGEEVVEVIEEATAEENYAATVAAVANQLSQQVATSIAAGTEAVEQATQTSVVAVAGEVVKPQVAAPKVDVGQAVETQMDVQTAELSAKGSAKPSSQHATEQGESETSDRPSADSKTANNPVEKPVIAASAASAPALAESSAAAPTPAGQSTAPPIATVGETVSAQFAQLPQSDSTHGNDDVNVGRLTRGLNSAINQRGGSVTLRLTPPELGLVKIEMAVRDGAVSAKFTAQTESVRNLLMDQMSNLRQAMDRQGLTVEKFEVQVLPQASSSSAGGFDKQQDDMSRDGRSAGQYNSSQGGEGGRGSKQQQGGRGVDTFDRALADVAR